MSGPSLAGKSTRSGSFSLDKIVNNPEAEIQNADLARAYLDQLYMVQGEPATPKHILHTLFYILQTKGVNNMLRSAIRSMAYLVRELAALAMAETVIKAVSSNIENSVVAAISPQIAKILSTAKKLEKVNESATLLNNNYAQRIESIANMTNSADTHCLEGEIPLGKCLSLEHAKAHAAIKEGQLLINPNSNHPTLNSSSSRESIIEVIKLALEAIEEADSPDLQLKLIMQLHNNSILLELNTHEAIAWIKEPINKAAFLTKLGGKVTIKNCHYNIVIPFLPISTNMELPDTLHGMESENNILHESIAQIKWIKDLAKHSPNQ
ncbi:hypothetical protein M404DRAFT_162882 [Pisolithus tinctorius Marx 270]|uniref:Uncharacterized protein n=1 Tax=Pisolithus tinctorius Marx 270 TaxID=870435 RepID=A0A0C3IHJ6_PISTI|nr:hypothetical protein M404DRAFT_162882 [Pisolithus tinctorius Marx 270]